MDSVLFYCCVLKKGRVLFHYNKVRSNNVADGQEHSKIEDMAALCLEMILPYHRWYFHTMGRKTVGFLTEDDDGFTYFAIVDHSFGKQRLLRFLRMLRDETRKRMNVNKPWKILQQEQFIPAVDHLVASLQNANADDPLRPTYNEIFRPHQPPSSTSSYNNMRATLLRNTGTIHKHREEKKMKDHVVVVRGGDHVEIQEEDHHQRSIHIRGATNESSRILEHENGESSSSSSSTAYPKDINNASQNVIYSQSLHKKWCRHVKIVLAVDAAICIVLLVVWLAICHGIKCIR